MISSRNIALNFHQNFLKILKIFQQDFTIFLLFKYLVTRLNVFTMSELGKRF